LIGPTPTAKKKVGTPDQESDHIFLSGKDKMCNVNELNIVQLWQWKTFVKFSINFYFQ
jgi:hypothetical protein